MELLSMQGQERINMISFIYVVGNKYQININDNDDRNTKNNSNQK